MNQKLAANEDQTIGERIPNVVKWIQNQIANCLFYAETETPGQKRTQSLSLIRCLLPG